jgi:hypothetical protein
MRRFALCPVLLAFAATLALGASRASRASAAEPRRTSSLGWARLPGAETCIGARDLAIAVERLLGRPVFVSPAQADVLIEGRIEPAPSGFRAHVVLSSAAGQVLGSRDLDGPGASCRTLDEPIALVVGLLIDPEALLAPKPPPPAPEAPRVVVERVYVPVPAPAPPCEPWRTSVTAGPLLALGLLPGAGYGLSLRGEIIPPKLFPFELGGTVFLDAHADVSSQSVEGASVELSYGFLGACPLALRADAWRVAACAEVGVGAVRAVGTGFALPGAGTKEQAYVHAGLAGRVARRIVGPLEVGVGVGLLIPLRPAQVQYEDKLGNTQELFHMSAVAGVFDASVGLAFP